MTIITQNKKDMFNYDNSNGISIKEFGRYDRTDYAAEIVIKFSTEQNPIRIGRFKTIEKANKVFNEIIDAICEKLVYEVPGE